MSHRHTYGGGGGASGCTRADHSVVVSTGLYGMILLRESESMWLRYHTQLIRRAEIAAAAALNRPTDRPARIPAYTI